MIADYQKNAHDNSVIMYDYTADLLIGINENVNNHNLMLRRHTSRQHSHQNILLSYADVKCNTMFLLLMCTKIQLMLQEKCTLWPQ